MYVFYKGKEFDISALIHFIIAYITDIPLRSMLTLPQVWFGKGATRANDSHEACFQS